MSSLSLLSLPVNGSLRRRVDVNLISPQIIYSVFFRLPVLIFNSLSYTARLQASFLPALQNKMYDVSICVCRRHMKICITATWASEGLHDILQLVHVKQDEVQSAVLAVVGVSRCGDSSTIFRRLAEVDCRSVNVTDVASTSADHSGGKKHKHIF